MKYTSFSDSSIYLCSHSCQQTHHFSLQIENLSTSTLAFAVALSDSNQTLFIVLFQVSHTVHGSLCSTWSTLAVSAHRIKFKSYFLPVKGNDSSLWCKGDTRCQQQSYNNSATQGTSARNLRLIPLSWCNRITYLEREGAAEGTAGISLI